MTFIQKLVHILLVLTNKNNYIYTSWSWSPSLWSSSPQVTTTIIKKKKEKKKKKKTPKKCFNSPKFHLNLTHQGTCSDPLRTSVIQPCYYHCLEPKFNCKSHCRALKEILGLFKHNGCPKMLNFSLCSSLLLPYSWSLFSLPFAPAMVGELELKWMVMNLMNWKGSSPFKAKSNCWL